MLQQELQSKNWKVLEKTGDLGLTSEELIKKKKQHTLFSEELTVEKVSRIYKNYRQ